MTDETPSRVPRGRLRHGDVVEVYRTDAGQHHHTERGCHLLGRGDGTVESARVGVDSHGGVQVRTPLCDACRPFYRRVPTDTDEGDGEGDHE